MTSKLQVTIPKVIADRYGIEPGAELEWLPAGEAIRVVPPSHRHGASGRERRLRLFDAATARQRDREHGRLERGEGDGRGWRRDDLYARGGAVPLSEDFQHGRLYGTVHAVNPFAA